jgi:hypothetical protein
MSRERGRNSEEVSVDKGLIGPECGGWGSVNSAIASQEWLQVQDLVELRKLERRYLLDGVSTIKRKVPRNT